MFGFEIRQCYNLITNPAFDHTRHVVVIDLADGVIIGRIVEWPELGVVNTFAAAVVSDVVGDNVNHQVHATAMKCVGKSKQVLSRSEVIVDFVHILLPVSMISTVSILRYRGDPYSAETHPLNVIKVIY